MNKAAEFFYAHAGFSYDPAKETAKQGRARGATRLATAERWARDEGYSFEWSTSDIDSSDFSDEPVRALFDCTMRDATGKCVQSLCACDFGEDADGPYGDYRRVVEAELALAQMSC